MKATRRFRNLLAIFVIALTTLLVNFVEGQQTGNGAVIVISNPPASLPMGNITKFLDFIVKDVVVGNRVDFTNSIGQEEGIVPLSFASNFTSYAEFKVFVCRQGMGFLKYLLSMTGDTAVSPNSDVEFSMALSRNYYLESQCSLLIGVNLGKLSQITSNSFLNLPYRYAQAIVAVPGLKWFTINVGDGDYFFACTNGVPYYRPVKAGLGIYPPREAIVTNAIVLKEWYSTNGFKVRLTVNASGQTRTYTQYGEPLDLGKLSCTPGWLTATFARGADVAIESSTNMVNWTTLTNLPGSLGINSAKIAVRPDLPRLFFRAKVQ